MKIDYYNTGQKQVLEFSVNIAHYSFVGTNANLDPATIRDLYGWNLLCHQSDFKKEKSII